MGIKVVLGGACEQACSNRTRGIAAWIALSSRGADTKISVVRYHCTEISLSFRLITPWTRSWYYCDNETVHMRCIIRPRLRKRLYSTVQYSTVLCCPSQRWITRDQYGMATGICLSASSALLDGLERVRSSTSSIVV